ncbi:splicing factor, suppressor of white-apricot homolog [Glandiceps talaboti]
MALFGKKSRQKRAVILDRKKSEAPKTREEELDELFVFGYSAKLFRDDEKAKYIDRGNHLIPWMGDESLMIDRYDGRGYLHNLSEYEMDSWNREYQLSEEEARIEALCDEERYLALHTDLLEEQHRQEEELKRLNEAIAISEDTYQAVGFSYDDLPSSSTIDTYDPTQPTDDYEDDADKENQEKEESPEADEEPFVAPEELEIPSDMEVPATLKTNAIIEKTAQFVKGSGPQFEIILKTKQSGNSQFGFLNYDHYLNPYYKHLLKYVQSGKYKPKFTSSKDKDENNHRKSSNDDESSHHSDEEESDADSSGYLHPSLLASRKAKSPKRTDAPPWPGGTGPSTLSILTAGASSAMGGPVYGPMLPGIPPLPPPAASTTTNSGTSSTPLIPPPLPPFMGVAPDGSVVAPHPSAVPPTAVDVNSVSVQSFTVSQPVTTLSGITALTAAPPPPPPEEDSTSVTTTTSSAPPIPTIVPPPPDVQPVIDKMAKYVAKNGVEFEATVRAKSDSRFEFLLPWHNYHSYYEYKKKLFIEEFDKDKDKGFLEPPKKARGPVSFSIKSKEPEERVTDSRSAFPTESSSESEGEDSDKCHEKYNPFTATEVFNMDKMLDKPKKPQLSLEELEARQAKQRLEDKLALAAREKLAQSSRERQLQLERKKKAAMFLNMLKSNNPATAAAAASIVDTPSTEVSAPSTSLKVPQVSPPQYVSDHAPTMRDTLVKVFPHSRSLSPVKRRSRSPPWSYRSSYRQRSHSQTRSRSRSPKRRRHRSPSPNHRKQNDSNKRERPPSRRERSPSLHYTSNRQETHDRQSDSPYEYDESRQMQLEPSVNEDLRAKVRAMLAASRQHPSS